MFCTDLSIKDCFVFVQARLARESTYISGVSACGCFFFTRGSRPKHGSDDRRIGPQ